MKLNIFIAKSAALVLLVLLHPELISLYPIWIFLDGLLLLYFLLAPFLKNIKKYYKDEMRKARVRKKEYDQWVKHYRSTKGYQL